MEYQPHQIYHVFNQGNNQQPIFFRTANYHYCIMHNHFHWLLHVRPDGCNRIRAVKTQKKYLNPEFEIQSDFQQNLSHKIGIILSSYTRAINIQERRWGSLFRAKTKVKNSNYQSKNNQELSGVDYFVTCFEYIHENPVSANLVNRIKDWEFSSAKDYLGLRKDSICNISLTERIIWQC